MTRMTPDQAAARAGAALGREPQDALETSVVLEAWGGITARTSLPLSRAASARRLPGSLHRLTASTPPSPTNSSRREVLGLVAVILATTAWVAPLASALGAGVTAVAWMTALPISLALQWFLRRRYFTGEDGVQLLRSDPAGVAVMATVGVGTLGWLFLDPSGGLPGALVVTWVGGLVIVVRGWGIAYALILLLATNALRWGVPVLVDVVAVVALTLLATMAAVVTSPASSGLPTPWRRCWPTALIGGLPGLLLIIDPTIVWSSTDPFPVVALVPSLLGGLWATNHLARVWTVLQRSLGATSLREVRHRANRQVFTWIVVGAFLRLVLATTAASVVVFVVLAPATPDRRGLALLLAGVGCFGVVGFLAALLEAFSRLTSAGLVVAAALLAGFVAVPGVLVEEPLISPLPAAALAATLVVVPLVTRLVRHPDRTLATLL